MSCHTVPMRSTEANHVSQRTHALKWSTVSLSAGLSHPHVPEGMRHGANGRELSQQAPKLSASPALLPFLATVFTVRSERVLSIQ